MSDASDLGHPLRTANRQWLSSSWMFEFPTPSESYTEQESYTGSNSVAVVRRNSEDESLPVPFDEEYHEVYDTAIGSPSKLKNSLNGPESQTKTISSTQATCSRPQVADAGPLERDNTDNNRNHISASDEVIIPTPLALFEAALYYSNLHGNGLHDAHSFDTSLTENRFALPLRKQREFPPGFAQIFAAAPSTTSNLNGSELSKVTTQWVSAKLTRASVGKQNSTTESDRKSVSAVQYLKTQNELSEDSSPSLVSVMLSSAVFRSMDWRARLSGSASSSSISSNSASSGSGGPVLWLLSRAFGKEAEFWISPDRRRLTQRSRGGLFSKSALFRKGCGQKPIENNTTTSGTSLSIPLTPKSTNSKSMTKLSAASVVPIDGVDTPSAGEVSAEVNKWQRQQCAEPHYMLDVQLPPLVAANNNNNSADSESNLDKFSSDANMILQLTTPFPIRDMTGDLPHSTVRFTEVGHVSSMEVVRAPAGPLMSTASLDAYMWSVDTEKKTLRCTLGTIERAKGSKFKIGFDVEYSF